jgi:hypothetical protein
MHFEKKEVLLSASVGAAPPLGRTKKAFFGQYERHVAA